jgi:hypothetical protein
MAWTPADVYSLLSTTYYIDGFNPLSIPTVYVLFVGGKTIIPNLVQLGIRAINSIIVSPLHVSTFHLS